MYHLYSVIIWTNHPIKYREKIYQITNICTSFKKCMRNNCWKRVVIWNWNVWRVLCTLIRISFQSKPISVIFWLYVQIMVRKNSFRTWSNSFIRHFYSAIVDAHVTYYFVLVNPIERWIKHISYEITVPHSVTLSVIAFLTK